MASRYQRIPEAANGLNPWIGSDVRTGRWEERLGYPTGSARLTFDKSLHVVGIIGPEVAGCTASGEDKSSLIVIRDAIDDDDQLTL